MLSLASDRLIISARDARARTLFQDIIPRAVRARQKADSLESVSGRFGEHRRLFGFKESPARESWRIHRRRRRRRRCRRRVRILEESASDGKKCA